MVCKDDFLLWFKSLSSYKRIDMMNSLFNMCIPFEIRFLGSNIEERAKHDYDQLMSCEKIANNLLELENDLPTNSSGIFDMQIRHKLTLYISLLRSNNYKCATWIYLNFLKNSNWLGVLSNSMASVAELFDELLLLYVLAYYHPAFRFEDKLEIGQVVIRLEEDYNKHFTKLNSPADWFFTFNPQSPSTVTVPSSATMVNHIRYPFPNVNFIKTAVINHINANSVMHNEVPNPLPPPGLNFPSTPVTNEPLTNDQQQQQQQTPNEPVWHMPTMNDLMTSQNNNYRHDQPQGHHERSSSSPTLSEKSTSSDDGYQDKFSYPPPQMHQSHFHPQLSHQPRSQSQSQLQPLPSQQAQLQPQPQLQPQMDNHNLGSLDNQINDNEIEKSRISGWVETGYPRIVNGLQYLPQVQSLKIEDTNSVNSSKSNSPDSSCTELPPELPLANKDITATETVSAPGSTPLTSIHSQNVPLHGPGRGPTAGPPPKHDRNNETIGAPVDYQPLLHHLPPQQTIYTNCTNMPYTATPCIQSHMLPTRTVFAYPAQSHHHGHVHPNAHNQAHPHPHPHPHVRSHYIVQSSNNEIIFPIPTSSSYLSPVLYSNLIAQQPVLPHKTNCWNCGSESHLAHDCKEQFTDHFITPSYHLDYNYSTAAKSDK